MAVTRELALAGHDLAILPDFMIRDDLKMEVLIRVTEDRPLASATAWIVAAKQLHRFLAVRVVIDHLVGA